MSCGFQLISVLRLGVSDGDLTLLHCPPSVVGLDLSFTRAICHFLNSSCPSDLMDASQRLLWNPRGTTFNL